MSTPKALILRAPGTNCDQETAYAFQQAGAETELIHINALMDSPGLLDQFQIACLPGGFSYGDDIAAGRIMATQMQAKLSDSLKTFREAGKLILGICNGFQILIKSGLLVDPIADGPSATLTWNDSGRFVDCWVNLKTNQNKCVFLKDVEEMYLPIAHAEGKFVMRDESVLQHMEQANQIALMYQAGGGLNADQFNPNGSTADIAGVCDNSGRVFGLMPHPERHIDPTHHPRWTREGLKPEGDGMAIFRNAVAYFA